LVLYLKGSAELSELCSGSALVLSPNGTIDTEHSEFSPKVQWLTVMLYTTTLPICIIKNDFMGSMFSYMYMFCWP